MNQNNYVIGLDLGINNVGWSILNLDNGKIEKTGVRLFNPSEEAKDRRNARSVRRRYKREKNRINDSSILLKQIDFPYKKTIDQKLIQKRCIGLKEKINKQDISNIIFYLMTHRGYIPYNDEEQNTIDLNGIYPCQYFLNLFNTNGKYRAINETVKHSELSRELEKILETQSQYYPELKEIKNGVLEIFSRKREFWEGPGSINSFTKYGRFKKQEDADNYQKQKEENPNYEKYLFEDLIGSCDIYLNEKCAPKSNFYAQEFNLLNDFVNLTFTNIENTTHLNCFVETQNGYKLSEIGLSAIIDYCINYNSTSLKSDKLFKDLFNIKKENISGFRVNNKNEFVISTFDELRALKRVSSKLKYNCEWLFNDIEKYNKLIYYINVCPSGIKLYDILKNDAQIGLYVDEQSKEFIIAAYKTINDDKRKGYHSLSEKALKRACKDMLTTQMSFQQVKKRFNYDKEKKEYFSKKYISEDGKIRMTSDYIEDLIASPQVKKSLRQAIKVINSIIDEQNSLPYCIAVESAKELNGKETKKEIDKMQSQKEQLRKEAMEIIINNKKEVSENLIERVMLYKEINGRCPYCNEKEISLDDVLNSRVQIEHILPISKSMDNSFENKTLSCISCNSSSTGKGNKTPYEWRKNIDFEDFAERISNNHLMSDEKKKNFLYSDDINKYNIRFFNRNLRDTAYATKELINQINLFNYFLKEKYNLRINTLSTPGQITHKIRKDNILEKNRNAGKFHHAVDASIVAAISNTNIGKIIIDSQNNSKFWLDNSNKINEVSKLLLSVNIKDNIDDIKKISNDNIYISSQVLNNQHGSLSNASIIKIIEKNGEQYKVSQIDNIYEEKNDKLMKIFDENSTMHLMIKENNPKLYSFLKGILEEYKNKTGNAFKNYCFDKNRGENFETLKDFIIEKHGIHSSTNNMNSPIIKKLRYYSKVTNPYLLHKKNIECKDKTYIGLDSLKMAFTEIYHDIDNNCFAFLPIYSILINKKSGKVNREDKYYINLKKEFLPGNNYQFICRLYNGNIINLKKSNGAINKGSVSGFDKYTRRIALKEGFIFTKSDKGFTLIDVDVLGNEKERLTFEIK